MATLSDGKNLGGDHAQTVANHYNQLEETGLQKRTLSRIFYLRNFNNWIKSVLISDTLKASREKDPHKNISVLDLCSGKGGDMLKWKKGRINSIVCADIAATSVEQSEQRHRQSSQRDHHRRIDAEFIVADCTKVRLKDKYRDPNQRFDLVSCQFSFHYCFESYPQAMMMLRNACECLKPGGYFIGTTPNSNEIVHRLRRSEGFSFGNEVYSVTFSQEDKNHFPLFGATYNFHLEGVVDCPEFLVFFPVFEKMAAKFGMKLIHKKSFAEFFRENVSKHEHLNLLSTMQALEPYPQKDGSPVSSNADDYKVAKEFLAHVDETDSDQRGGHQGQTIGTLSQSEWEAATLYLAFVFQKVEDVTPSFEKSSVLPSQSAGMT